MRTVVGSPFDAMAGLAHGAQIARACGQRHRREVPPQMLTVII
jgi:hypothetical protein